MRKRRKFPKARNISLPLFHFLNLRRAEAGVLPLNAKIKTSSVAHHELHITLPSGLWGGLTLLLLAQHRNTALSVILPFPGWASKTNELLPERAENII